MCLFSIGKLSQSSSLILILTALCSMFLFILYYSICKTKKEQKNLGKKLESQWKLHPDIHKASVINNILQKLWPYLKYDLNNLFQLLSMNLSNLVSFIVINVVMERFPEKGPTFTGVKILKISDRDKLMVDLNMEYFNSCPFLSFQFMTNWKFPKCYFKLQRLNIKGTFRLEFDIRKGDSILEISSIYISSLEIPTVDVTFGFFSDLLFIDHLISYFIDQFLENNLLLPHKFTLYKDEIKFEQMYQHPQGVLNIAILEARNLINNDKFSPSPNDVSDPYARININVDSRNYIYQSQVIQDDLNPVWNYICQIPIEDITTISDLSITVMDKDELTKDDLLGTCYLLSDQIAHVIQSKEDFCSWNQLWIDNKTQGELKLFLSFSSVKESCSRDILSDGILAVFIDSFTDLNVTLYSHPHWRFRASVENNVILSRSLQFGKNPVFREKHIFHIKDPGRKELVVNIFNTKDKKSGGYLNLALLKIIQSHFQLSNLTSEYLQFESPMYQSKDSKIQVACQFWPIHHSDEIKELMKDSILLQREPKNLKKISKAKMYSIIQSVKRNKMLFCKVKLNIFYREENSVISISINSIENVSNLLIRTKFDRSLKIKLRNKEKIQKNSFKIELKSINDDNILNIDRKVDFRLSKRYFQKSEIIVSKE